MTEPPAFTWWGHASATVELGGARVALDPLLSNHLFHLHRYSVSPAAEATDVDVVLVSHLHRDHLHLPSLRRFGDDVPLVVPRGGERLLRGIGSDRIVPATPGETLHLAGARIDVLPATHDEHRGPGSSAVGPALGFRDEAGGHSLWFPGDTELRADMADVGHVDLAMVPIGGWGPTLEDGHMDPVDGARAVGLVGATTAVPVHWGTFWPVGLRHVLRANHDRLFTTPGERFAAALADSGAGAVSLIARQGERVAL
jgi:L-ascorbate metabolism protein UlaG (beta-lactamase superfamily)